MAVCLTIQKFGFWFLTIRISEASKNRFLNRFLKPYTTPSSNRHEMTNVAHINPGPIIHSYMRKSVTLKNCLVG